jgi:prevent-host-death family protein
MDKTISAAEANRRFSEILRGTRDGQTYVVTSHGKPVARIAPAGEVQDAARRAALLRRLKNQPASRKTRRWKRDELYED